MRKDWEKCEMTKIEHSKSFWTTLVGKYGEKCEKTKIGGKRLEKVQNNQTKPELSLNSA